MSSIQKPFFRVPGLNINLNSIVFTGVTSAGVVTNNSTGLCTSRLIQNTDIQNNTITINNLASNILDNITGVTGAQGATGVKGPTGIQGEMGNLGPTGAQGEMGNLGPTGANGAIGTNGSIGNLGSIGSLGATGAQGLIGSTGLVAGERGPQGLPGPFYSNVTVTDNNGATAIFLVGVSDVASEQSLFAIKNTVPLSYIPSTSTLSLENLSLSGAIENSTTTTDVVIRTTASSTSLIRFAPNNENSMKIDSTGSSVFLSNINLTTTSKTFTSKQLGYCSYVPANQTVNNLVSGQIYNIFNAVSLEPGVYIFNLFFAPWGDNSANIIDQTCGVSTSSTSFVGGTGELSITPSQIFPNAFSTAMLAVGGYSIPFVVTSSSTAYNILYRITYLSTQSINFTGGTKRAQCSFIRVA